MVLLAPLLIMLAVAGLLLLMPGRWPRLQRAVGALALIVDLAAILFVARLVGVGL